MAPRPKPMAAGNTFTNPSPGLISIDGANKLQKLAATIIPPVNPSIPSNMPRCIDLMPNTIAAPAAVRIALPEANETVALTSSLAITFPFNLTLGIPLLLALAQRLAGVL